MPKQLPMESFKQSKIKTNSNAYFEHNSNMKPLFLIQNPELFQGEKYYHCARIVKYEVGKNKEEYTCAQQQHIKQKIFILDVL